VIAALGEKLPRACIVPAAVGPAIVKADCIRFKPDDRYSPQFLYYALNWEGTQKRTAAIVHGVGRPRLNLSEIKSILLPIAPLCEQQRIVTEIEKQFTRLDAGVSALVRVQTSLKHYRAAVLQAACEGRLGRSEADVGATEQGASTSETSEDLLRRILTERRRHFGSRRKYKEPVAPDAYNLSALPPGWLVASIDQLTDRITSGSRDWSQFYNRGTGTFILAQNVRPMRLDLSERQTVDAPKMDAETERTRVQRDDILITIVGARTGDVCRIPIDLEEHFVCQSVALIRPVLPESAKFLELYLASQEDGQAQWKRYMYGQGRPHLSFEQVRMTAIPFPPLAEQIRIVAEVERRLSVVEELEATISTNLQRAGRLRQSILQKAFTGDLV
jgi:type I restriction enzyme, S subunit